MKKNTFLLVLLLTLFFLNSRSQIVYSAGANGDLSAVMVTIPSGNTIANTTTETAFNAPQMTIGSDMWYVGRVFHVKVAGIFSTAVVVPSITGRIKIGSTTIGSTGSVATAVSLSNKGWDGYVDITCTSTGVAGTIEVQGQILFQSAVGTSISFPIVNTSPITIDMTTNQILTLTAQWGAASTSNTITLRQFIFKG